MRSIDALLVLGLVTKYAAGQLDTAGIKLPLPTRELEWKDVNFISISDSHGWLLGHQHATWPEPNYSGDYGDFASFTEHLRASAQERNVDLLLVDAGDHHDGSGLVSSSRDSAQRADEIFNMVKYDIMTIGNHELYAYDSARWLYDNIERYGGRYLTSNVEIVVEKEGQAKSVPIGEKFVKFTTEEGSNVTAFGVIFDFKAHGPNITVISPKSMVKDSWFLEAIASAPTYFVIAGHMPVRGADAEFSAVIDAIRAVHPTIPVFVFGGHTHVRDCVTFDDHSIGVVPGRYMETIAFTSSSLPADGRRLNMSRRYIDANRQSYKYHSKTNDHTFDTPNGRNITTSLLRLASSLHISTPLGKAPHDLFLSRYPIGHPRHVATVFGDKALPAVLVDTEREGEKLIIANTGTLRFDLFQGRFDRNDELTVSPFDSAFLYVPLRAGLARNITAELNRAGASRLLPWSPATKEAVEARVHGVYNEWLSDQWQQHLAARSLDSSIEPESEAQAVFEAPIGAGSETPTMGYVTKDLCPGRGDDIEHVPVPHYWPQPDFFSSPMLEVDNEEMIDVVICDFALIDFLAAVNTLAPSMGLGARDMQPYAEGVKVNEVWGKYASQAWK